MLTRKLTAPVGLIFLLTVLFCGCNKTPTSTTPDTPESISLACDPSSGGPGASITIAALIAGNNEEIRVFGFDATFDTKMFEFQSVGNGSLTGNWQEVDGNEPSPGSLKVGGFVGSGTSIAKNSNGTLVAIRFKVTGQAYGNGKQSQICIRSYTDDISGFTPSPACTTFTLKK